MNHGMAQGTLTVLLFSFSILYGKLVSWLNKITNQRVNSINWPYSSFTQQEILMPKQVIRNL